MKVTKKMKKEMTDVFDSASMARTPYALEQLVVWANHTDEQRYAQCVLELSIKYDNLRLAEIVMDLKKLEILDLKDKKDEKSKLERRKLDIEQEQTARAMLWAEREFAVLYKLRLSFEKRYTREEINDASPREFEAKLKTQALLDIASTGKVSSWNLEWLRQIGVTPQEAMKLWVKGRDDVEAKFLEEWKLRAMLVIPTEHKLSATQTDELLNHVELPTNCEFKIVNKHSSPVADNYNSAFEEAVKHGCTHIITLEDDQVLEKDSIIKIMDSALDNPNCAVWAWYVKRQETRQGVHIELSSWWHRKFMDADGSMKEAKTLAMWLTVYPVDILKEIDFPRCKTTNSLTQDSYLSQKIRDAWYKCLVDTAVIIGHKDRKTGKIYS